MWRKLNFKMVFVSLITWRYLALTQLQKWLTFTTFSIYFWSARVYCLLWCHVHVGVFWRGRALDSVAVYLFDSAAYEKQSCYTFFTQQPMRTAMLYLLHSAAYENGHALPSSLSSLWERPWCGEGIVCRATAGCTWNKQVMLWYIKVYTFSSMQLVMKTDKL